MVELSQRFRHKNGDIIVTTIVEHFNRPTTVSQIPRVTRPTIQLPKGKLNPFLLRSKEVRIPDCSKMKTELGQLS
jgi:hypothetical protein